MTTKTEITKEEFLRRMERSVQHAERQPGWMIGRPENRRQTSEKELLRTTGVDSAPVVTTKK